MILVRLSGKQLHHCIEQVFGYKTLFFLIVTSIRQALSTVTPRFSDGSSKRNGGVMVNVIDCGIVVNEFEFQSRYYVHFRINTLGKGMNPLILPAMG